MLKKNKWNLMSVLIIVLMMIGAMAMLTACGGQEEGSSQQQETTAEETEATEASEAEGEEVTINEVTGLNEKEEAALMQQIADKEQEKMYADKFPSEIFANAEFFGADKDGDNVTAYALLSTSQYARIKDKAYVISGGQGEAIIKYTYGDDGPTLQEVIWSADGGEHGRWMEENFPKEYLEKDREYQEKNTGAKSPLQERDEATAQERLGVPVETENIVNIDEDNGTFEIVKTIETGSPEEDNYKFETEVVDKGQLSDIK